MKKNYDIINIFLIFFIFYYLLFIISDKYKNIIEGVNNDTTSDMLMCEGNQSDTYGPEDDFNRCSSWPFKFKTQSRTTKQCIDGSSNCSQKTKIMNCCDQRAEMCQGNIDQRFNDWTCTGDDNIPKIDATELPRLCDSENTENCWDEGRIDGTPPGLNGCSDIDETCNLSNLPNDELRQELCCTNYALYSIAETIWGRPHLLSVANLKFNDLKKIRETQPEKVNGLLNEALDYLNQARKLSDEDQERSIIETINDWSRELNIELGSGMCRGNINPIEDFPCTDLNKEYNNDSFIIKGSISEECCIIMGMCSGNTNFNENVTCPDNTTVIQGKEGTTVDDCCENDIKCRGNENINLNYDCPEPMIPVYDSNNTYGNTKEICCRYPEEKHITEINPISEDETIKATLIFNGLFYESVGEEKSEKRVLFINNFKEDLLDILNKEKKISILLEQIIVKDIYQGSIMVDFEILPHNVTGLSISKDYFSYLLSNKTYFPIINLHTNGSVINVAVESWYNIKTWPKWFIYLIVSITTFMITMMIFL